VTTVAPNGEEAAESERKVNRSQQWYTLTQIIYPAYQRCRRDATGVDPPARSYG
jgi:hypothetical protein